MKKTLKQLVQEVIDLGILDRAREQSRLIKNIKEQPEDKWLKDAMTALQGGSNVTKPKNKRT